MLRQDVGTIDHVCAHLYTPPLNDGFDRVSAHHALVGVLTRSMTYKMDMRWNTDVCCGMGGSWRCAVRARTWWRSRTDGSGRQGPCYHTRRFVKTKNWMLYRLGVREDIKQSNHDHCDFVYTSMCPEE